MAACSQLFMGHYVAGCGGMWMRMGLAPASLPCFSPRPTAAPNILWLNAGQHQILFGQQPDIQKNILLYPGYTPNNLRLDPHLHRRLFCLKINPGRCLTRMLSAAYHCATFNPDSDEGQPGPQQQVGKWSLRGVTPQKTERSLQRRDQAERRQQRIRTPTAANAIRNLPLLSTGR